MSDLSKYLQNKTARGSSSSPWDLTESATVAKPEESAKIPPSIVHVSVLKRKKRKSSLDVSDSEEEQAAPVKRPGRRVQDSSSEEEESEVSESDGVVSHTDMEEDEDADEDAEEDAEVSDNEDVEVHFEETPSYLMVYTAKYKDQKDLQLQGMDWSRWVRRNCICQLEEHSEQCRWNFDAICGELSQLGGYAPQPNNTLQLPISVLMSLPLAVDAEDPVVCLTKDDTTMGYTYHINVMSTLALHVQATHMFPLSYTQLAFRAHSKPVIRTPRGTFVFRKYVSQCKEDIWSYLAYRDKQKTATLYFQQCLSTFYSTILLEHVPLMIKTLVTQYPKLIVSLPLQYSAPLAERINDVYQQCISFLSILEPTLQPAIMLRQQTSIKLSNYKLDRNHTQQTLAMILYTLATDSTWAGLMLHDVDDVAQRHTVLYQLYTWAMKHGQEYHKNTVLMGACSCHGPVDVPALQDWRDQWACLYSKYTTSLYAYITSHALSVYTETMGIVWPVRFTVLRVYVPFLKQHSFNLSKLHKTHWGTISSCMTGSVMSIGGGLGAISTVVTDMVWYKPRFHVSSPQITCLFSNCTKHGVSRESNSKCVFCDHDVRHGHNLVVVSASGFLLRPYSLFQWPQSEVEYKQERVHVNTVESYIDINGNNEEFTMFDNIPVSSSLQNMTKQTSLATHMIKGTAAVVGNAWVQGQTKFDSIDKKNEIHALNMNYRQGDLSVNETVFEKMKRQGQLKKSLPKNHTDSSDNTIDLTQNTKKLTKLEDTIILDDDEEEDLTVVAMTRSNTSNTINEDLEDTSFIKHPVAQFYSSKECRINVFMYRKVLWTPYLAAVHVHHSLSKLSPTLQNTRHWDGARGQRFMRTRDILNPTYAELRPVGLDEVVQSDYGSYIDPILLKMRHNK